MSYIYHETCHICELKELCEHSRSFENQKQTESNIVKKVIKFKKNEGVLSASSQLESIYVVKSGAFKSYEVDIMGKEHINNFYFPGDIIGLDAIRMKQHPYATKTVVSGELCSIPITPVLDYIARFPQLQAELIEAMSYSLNISRYITATTAEQKLASFLINMERRIHDADNLEAWELPMSRYDIAEFLGLTPETVSRTLTTLKRNQLIRVDGKSISILDKERLRKLL